VVLDQSIDAVTVGDVNFDGLLDIVAASQSAGEVTVILNQGNRGFAIGSSHDLQRLPHRVQVADKYGDRTPDIVITDAAGIDVATLEGRGDGGFVGTASTESGVHSHPDASPVQLLDLQPKGSLDAGRILRMLGVREVAQ